MKRMSLRILALLCALCLLCVPACAETGDGAEEPEEVRFSDVSESDWFYEPVYYLAERDILRGFEDGTFRPRDTLTEMQLMKLMLKPFMPGEVEEPRGAQWWMPYAEFGLREGILTVEDLASLEEPASRLRAAVLLARLPLLPDTEDHPAEPDREGILAQIADLEEIPEEDLDAVIAVYGAGIMQGYDDGCFHGERTLTRAEGAAVILRLMLPSERQPKLRHTVPEEWFSDALILGNSHCGGLSMYGELALPDFSFSYGGNVFSGLDMSCRDRHERSFTLRSLLQEKQYGKIILVYGTNEMGYDIDYLRPRFAAFLDKLAEVQPDARFWLCTAPPVNPDMIGEQELPVFTVANCRAINALIRELAEERGFGVIDVYGLFADEEGVLPPESTGDGIHLTMECYRIWGRYLASAVVPEGEAEAAAGEETSTEEETPVEEETPSEEEPPLEEEPPEEEPPEEEPPAEEPPASEEEDP